MKMEQVKDLYQEIMQDMKAQMMALKNMAKKPQLNNQQMQNMMNRFDKQKFSEELDRTLATLKKAKRKFRKNLKRLEKLLKDHEEVQNLISQNKQVSTTLSNSLNENFNKIKNELDELSDDKGLESELREQLKKSLQEQGARISHEYSMMKKSIQKITLKKLPKTTRKFRSIYKNYNRSK